MTEITKKWYVVRVAGGKEKKAKELLDNEIRRLNLDTYISNVLIPTEKVYQVKNGKKVSTEKIFFPGYILVEAHLTAEIQHIIRNTTYIAGFLSDGGKSAKEYGVPTPLRPAEINRILGNVDEAIEREEENVVQYTPGEKVRIIDGPFSGFDGTVEEGEDKKKLKVSVIIFGRKTMVELNIVQVTK